MTALSAEVIDLEIEVPRHEVERLLGYPCTCRPTAPVQRELEELWPRAMQLLQARGAFRMVSEVEAEAAGVPESSPTVGVGVCTVGPALEAEAQRLEEEGDLLGALIVDAFGSAAAEAAAEALDHYLCAAAGADGSRAERRISPGYGPWEIRSQRQLLALLPIAELGIRLTPAMMMLPRKSVSFAIPFGTGAASHERNRERCATCDLAACAYRRDVSNHDPGAPRTNEIE